MRVALIFGAAFLAIVTAAYGDDIHTNISAPSSNRNGTLYVSNALGDHMVLQRAPAGARLWGTTVDSDIIRVSLTRDDGNLRQDHKEDTRSVQTDRVFVSASASESGKWFVYLPPIKAGGPYKLTMTSNATGDTVTFSDVMFGDVYLCGGQSNMEFVVSQSFDGAKEIKHAKKYEDIRMFTVGQGNLSATPLDYFASIEQGWSVASSESIGGEEWTHISAVCWYFGKEMYEALNKRVPIGLMSSNWGGTPVQAWSSPDALAKCKQPESNYETPEEQRHQSLLKDNSKKHTPSKAAEMAILDMTVGGPRNESALWNAMIVPLLNMRFIGAIWYQGEANVIDGGQYYSCQFPAMIADWREKMGLPDLYFGFVQLAPFKYQGTHSLADLRFSQMAALGNMSAMAVTIDTGDIDSPYGDIHPENKSVVGKRLSLSARALLFDHDVEYSSPLALYGAILSPSTNTSTYVVIIDFYPPSVGPKGLVVNEEPTVPCPPAMKSGTWCAGLQFYDSNGVPVGTATGVKPVGGSHLQVSCSECSSKPAYISYAFGDWPLATLYGSNALPVAPFYVLVH